MTPTPEYINICIETLAAWLQTQGYGCAIIAPTGGASFHQRSPVDEKAELFAKITALEEERAILWDVLTTARRYNSRGYGVENGTLRAALDDAIRAYDASLSARAHSCKE